MVGHVHPQYNNTHTNIPMSYQVLARKWRPRSFAELVGQEHVLRALINALDNDRLHHAFLFTGTRGVGKTTIARILAKSLNCENGISSTPCGVCSACTEINEGRFVDLIEVDAASRTKVEDTRELLENVQYSPTRGRYKVYLIDEVHMLSTHSFNALLKTLEEPPPHVKFLLATTDPQKLPVTILSRCLQFNLKRLPVEQIKGHLESILKQESVNAETSAILAIARAADGSMRDALSLLDQAIAYGSGALTADDVRTMLGSIEQSHITDILTLLAVGDAQKLMQRVDTLAEHAPDFAGVLSEMISCLHRIALAQVVPNTIDAGIDNHEHIQQLAQTLSPQDVQLYYQIALIGRKDLPLAPDPRSGFEMILLRMLAFMPDGLETTPRTGKKKPLLTDSQGQSPTASIRQALLTPAPQSSPTPTTRPTPTSAATPTARSSTRTHTDVLAKTASVQSGAAVTAQVSANEVMGTAEATAPAAAMTTANTTTNTATKTAAPITTENSVTSAADSDWESLVKQCNLAAIARQLAMNCAMKMRDENHVELCLSPIHKQLLSDARKATLEEALQTLLNSKVRLNISIEEPLGNTPAALEKQRQLQRQQAAESEIENDNALQQLMDTFDAKISPGSIQPVDKTNQ